jgi:hypothetical protein
MARSTSLRPHNPSQPSAQAPRDPRMDVLAIGAPALKALGVIRRAEKLIEENDSGDMRYARRKEFWDAFDPVPVRDAGKILRAASLEPLVPDQVDFMLSTFVEPFPSGKNLNDLWPLVSLVLTKLETDEDGPEGFGQTAVSIALDGFMEEGDARRIHPSPPEFLAAIRGARRRIENGLAGARRVLEARKAFLDRPPPMTPHERELLAQQRAAMPALPNPFAERERAFAIECREATNRLLRAELARHPPEPVPIYQDEG